jgi:hypothetical protein
MDLNVHHYGYRQAYHWAGSFACLEGSGGFEATCATTGPRRGIDTASQGTVPIILLLMLGSDEVIPARCEGVVIARLERPLEAANSAVEPSLKSFHLEGLYMAGTLGKVWRTVPVRMLEHCQG